MRRIEVISRARLLSILLSISAVVIALPIGVRVDSARAEPLPNGVPGTWSLIFDDEFSSAGLNTSVWTPEWQQNESISGQCTSPALVQQPGNGYLYLQVRAQASKCGGISVPDTGALVESDPGDGHTGHTGFLYSYGYVEWRVYIVGWGGPEQGCPRGGCIPDWPALWSFPENRETEIDTMEGLKGDACYHFHHHVSPIYEEGGCVSGSYAGWHTYGVDWEPGVLKYYYDGAKVWEYASSYISSAPQYLIMTDIPPGSYGGELVAPDEIVVDYVRVWQHPKPPTVSTGTASNVTPTQATLNGTVKPNGADTHYYFQYGTTTSYGLATGEVDAGSGWGAVGASASVGGLKPGSVYHYRLVARNSVNTSYGPDETLATPLPPNGSYYRVSNGANAGEILVAAGDALIPVTECGHFNGCAGYVEFSSEVAAEYQTTHPTIANGTLVRVGDGANEGEVTVAAGGAMVQIDECAAPFNCNTAVGADSRGLGYYEAAHPAISNGTLVDVANGANKSEIRVAAGGAVVQIDGCAAPFNCNSAVYVGSKGLGYYEAAHPTISSGTLVNVANGPNKGEVTVAAGGAMVQIDECAAPFNCNNAVYVGSKGLGYYEVAHPTIANGTFVRVANGANAGEISIAAGGAVLKVNECGPLGGCAGWVNVGSKGLSYYEATYPTITNGTYLLGLPSKTTWIIESGKREETFPSMESVSVTDVMLNNIPIG